MAFANPLAFSMKSMESTFVYRDLVSHIRALQQQMIEVENTLNQQWTTNKTELKSRSITFVDHMTNRTTQEYLDHEQINQIGQKYRNNYIPKYLQQWTKFGQMKQNSLSPLTDLELKSTVSNFKNGQEFVCYGELVVWIGTFEDAWPRKLIVHVSLMDKMEKVKMEIRKQRQFTDIELKLCVLGEKEKPMEKNWLESAPLKSEDTVLSSQLFQKNYVIIAKAINKTGNVDVGIEHFEILVGGGIDTTRLSVNSGMDIFTVKELFENQKGVPPKRSVLYFRRRLEDGRTLADYGISKGDQLSYACLLRGGMYHFTSGRIDLSEFSDNTAQAVKNVLAFHFESFQQSPLQLQNSLLKANTVLSTLFRVTEHFVVPFSDAHLKTVILPTPAANK